MQLLTYPFGTESNQVEDTSVVVDSPLVILGDDPTIQPVYAIIATPYDPATAGEVSVHLSGETFTTSASDSPASTTFDGGVSGPYRIQNQLFAGGQISGSSLLQPGEIEVENYDRAFDTLATYSWRARSVTVYVGLREWIEAGVNSQSVPSTATTFSNFARVFTGTAETASWQENLFTIRLRDNRYLLDVPIQETLYLGQTTVTGTDISFTASSDTIASTSTDFTGLEDYTYVEVSGSASNDGLYKISSVGTNAIVVDGAIAGLTDESAGASVSVIGALEGRDDLKGKPRPLRYGQVRQVELDLVDAARLIYRFHDGAHKSIGMTRDSGLDLDGGTTDRANAVALFDAVVTAGGYDTCIAEGLVKLAASPSGTVTADGEGASGSSLGYQSSTAGIVRKIIEEQVGLSQDDFEIATFNTLDADNSSVIGYSTDLEERRVITALDEILSSIGAFLTFSRTGRLIVGRVSDPSSETAETTFDDEDIWPESDGGKFLRNAANRPNYRVVVGYKRFWKTLGASDVAGAVSDTDRADLNKEFRITSPAEDATIQTEHKDADTRRVNSLLDTEAAADTEATRQLGLFGEERDLYEVRLRAGLFQYELGTIARIDTTASIYGLESGKNFVVVGFSEDAGSATRDQEITLFLWG